MNRVSGVVSYWEYETLMEKCIFAKGNEWLVTVGRFIFHEQFCHRGCLEDTHSNRYSKEQPAKKRFWCHFLRKYSRNWFSDLTNDPGPIALYQELVRIEAQKRYETLSLSLASFIDTAWVLINIPRRKKRKVVNVEVINYAVEYLHNDFYYCQYRGW